MKAKGRRGFFFSGRCFSARFVFLLLLQLPLSLATRLRSHGFSSLRARLPLLSRSLCAHIIAAALMLANALLLPSASCFALLISLHLPLKFFAAGRKRETERDANTQRPRERFQSLVAGAQFDVRQDTCV